jgi:hypothetical protein
MEVVKDSREYLVEVFDPLFQAHGGGEQLGHEGSHSSSFRKFV